MPAARATPSINEAHNTVDEVTVQYTSSITTDACASESADLLATDLHAESYAWGGNSSGEIAHAPVASSAAVGRGELPEGQRALGVERPGSATVWASKRQWPLKYICSSQLQGGPLPEPIADRLSGRSLSSSSRPTSSGTSRPTASRPTSSRGVHLEAVLADREDREHAIRLGEGCAQTLVRPRTPVVQQTKPSGRPDAQQKQAARPPTVGKSPQSRCARRAYRARCGQRPAQAVEPHHPRHGQPYPTQASSPSAQVVDQKQRWQQLLELNYSTQLREQWPERDPEEPLSGANPEYQLQWTMVRPQFKTHRLERLGCFTVDDAPSFRTPRPQSRAEVREAGAAESSSLWLTASSASRTGTPRPCSSRRECA